MKTGIIGLVLFLLGILLGMVLLKYNLFPVKQLKKLKNYILQESIQAQLPDNVYLTPYTAGVPLFSDRNYYDAVGDTILELTYVLQIPRHLKSPIEIEIIRPVKVYRLLTEENDNSIFNDWDFLKINVHVGGRSCTFTKVVSKYFSPGKIILDSGGPKAASPILIEDLSHPPLDFPIKILNMKKN
jgi:hypothetical protein